MNLFMPFRPRSLRLTRTSLSLLLGVVLLGFGAIHLHRYVEQRRHPHGSRYCAQEMQVRATALFASLQLNGVAVGPPRLVFKSVTYRTPIHRWALTWHLECEAEGRHVILMVDDATGQLRFWSSSFRRDPSASASPPRAAIVTPREAARVAARTVQSLALLPGNSAYRFTEIPATACHASVWMVNMEVRDARNSCREVRLMLDRKTGFPLMVRALPLS